MSSYQPNVNPGSPEGQALQAAIQKQLASLEWSTEDDPTMAEYCLVMLGNRKTPEQISGELSDLIGGDFDSSFVTWLFEEVKNHYPEPAPAAPSAAAPPTQPSNAASTSSTGLPARPTGPRSMFGAAVTGVKRDSREMGADGAREQPPNQRPRFDGNSRHGNGNGNGKSLFDRMGGKNAQFAPGPRNNGPLINTMGMPQVAFDAITQTIQAVNAGAHPSALASIPFPALASHPLSSTLPPPVLAQAQAHAMAQAQAFAQMQNVWGSPAGAFGAAAAAGGPQSGFNPQAAPFNPGAAFGRPPQNGGGFRGGAASQQSRRPTQPSPAAPPVVLPKKPELEAICKHGVECTKPHCGFSHPSPVATKESGLVLSSDACEKQLACQDQDCPKSHVSKAQKTATPSAVSTPSFGSTNKEAPLAAPPAAADPASLPGAGTKPCKFGGSCTRPGCVFMHPWDVRGDPNGGTVPCRYGAACTRSDCHFSHPPRNGGFNRSKFSATFNNKATPSTESKASSSSSSKAQQIGDWPKENPQHVSERLKRFAVQDDGSATEKIIPGQQQQPSSGGGGQVDEKKSNEEDKVEIHLDDEDDHKVKEKKEGATAAVTA